MFILTVPDKPLICGDKNNGLASSQSIDVGFGYNYFSSCYCANLAHRKSPHAQVSSCVNGQAVLRSELRCAAANHWSRGEPLVAAPAVYGTRRLNCKKNHWLLPSPILSESSHCLAPFSVHLLKLQFRQYPAILVIAKQIAPVFTVR